MDYIPPPENWLGGSPVCEDNRPMTMHIVLPTIEGGFVWVSDMGAGGGTPNNYVHVDKVLYLPTKNAACSMWGHYGIPVRNELGRLVVNSNVDLSNQDAVISLLERFCVTIITTIGINLSQQGIPQVVLVTGLDSQPRLYIGKIGLPPAAYATDNLICVGDEDNPSRVFVEHYYNRSGKTLNEALFLGVHAMRKAHEQKAAYIGTPNAWICHNGSFRRLAPTELQRCIKASESLDEAVLASASNFLLDATLR
jgi:hypothetical protein